MKARFVLGCLLSSTSLMMACGGNGPSGPGAGSPVASVTVSPARDTVDVADTLRLVATVKNRFGDVLTDRTITWSSSQPDVAQVDASGLVSALKAGEAEIDATVDDVSGSSLLTLLGPVAVVSVKPDTADLLSGASTNLTITVTDEAGHDLSARVTVDWSTSDGSVATVDGQGAVSGVASGTAVVRAAVAALRDSTVVRVAKALVFSELSAASRHTCGVTTDTIAYCWGSNSNGQLGQPLSVSDRDVPIEVARRSRFVSISAGGDHTCALDATGAAYCWGLNDRGQLGDGSAQDRATPTPVTGNVTFASIDAGEGHTCAVTASGAAYCWGANDRGQLGDGTNTDRSAPVAVTGGLTFAAVSAGKDHTCGVTTSNAGYCWGANDVGQVGDGTQTDRSDPTAISGGHAFASVSAGSDHSCGVTTADAALCWGANGSGQLGDGTNTERDAPATVSGGLSFAAVNAGDFHTCGVLTTGGAYCWGLNDQGQLGDASRADRSAPVAVSGGLPFASVTAGGSHSCGITDGPIAYCWGRGDSGQLGVGGNLPPPPGSQALTIPGKVVGQG